MSINKKTTQETELDLGSITGDEYIRVATTGANWKQKYSVFKEWIFQGDAKTGTITFNADGGGGVVTTGRKGGFWKCPYNGIITGWSLLEGTNTSSSCVIDTWKSASYPPTVADSIWTTKPALSSATHNSATGLSIAVTTGDIFAFNIDSCTSALYLTLVLIIIRS